MSIWLEAGSRLILRGVNATSSNKRLRAQVTLRDRRGTISVVSLVSDELDTARTPGDNSNSGIPEVGEAEVVAAAIASDVSGVKRGQLYAQLYAVGRTIADARTFLSAGYVYDGFWPTLGFIQEPGPGGGEGFLSVETVVADAAGNVVTTYTPAVTNGFRKLYGLVGYYNADSNAASRVFFITMTRAWGALPTGFATATNAELWEGPGGGMTLTASQEGSIFVYGKGTGASGFSLINTNGTLAEESTATAPIPFPLDILEAEPLTFLFEAVNGLAGDRYSAYALVEEWLVI